MPSKEDSSTLSPSNIDANKQESQLLNSKMDSESDQSETTESNPDDCTSPYPMDLPLEVITTVGSQPYSYPVLKNMSNGVLTHRNIFTESEREILTNIVDKYRGIVDTRSRTREIYLEKQTVWQQIVEEYNNTENVLTRTEKELRKCWDNMKYRARLAKKTQGKSNRSDSHQMACNAVQAVLEKILCVSPDSCPSENSCKQEGVDDVEGHSDDRSSHDLSEEDETPAFKKARQESPKLSSLLLGEHKAYMNGDPQRSPVSILPKDARPRPVPTLKRIPKEKGTHKQNGYWDEDLQKRLLQQRLQYEQAEHSLRLQLLRHQLQASSSECEYWNLKLDRLKGLQS